MANQRYVMDNSSDTSRERFKMLGGLLDPVTIEYMNKIGVAEGWKCLEVGGGGGSVVEWLCDRVGLNGQVVATDINTRLLESLDHENLKVLEHDIGHDELVDSGFDVVHCRWVLIHVPEREAALQKMMNALKPGGWLFVEEPDTSFTEPESTVDESLKGIFYKAREGIRQLGSARMDHSLAGRLPGLVRELGLKSVSAEGRTQYIQGGTLGAKVPQLRYIETKQRAIEAGYLTEQEIDDGIALFDNPSFAYRWDLTVSVWGQKA